MSLNCMKRRPSAAQIDWIANSSTGCSVVKSSAPVGVSNRRRTASAHAALEMSAWRAAQVEAMSAQLCRDLPGYQEKLDEGGEEHSAKVKAVIAGEVEKLEEMFDALLLKPLAAMGAEGPDGKVVALLIDALDELSADGSLQNVLRLLADHFPRLPQWVRVIVTSRDENRIK